MWRDTGCLFCGGDAHAADHADRCDGRQGRREAALELPILRAGLTAATWDTSSEAAESVVPTKDTQRAAVLAVIAAAGGDGVTDEEVQERLRIGGSSERPRRWELWKLEAIAVRRDASGAVVRRLTRTRRRAVVWVVARPVAS